MKRSFAPQFVQTHFLGVLVPDDITLTLEDCRRYMNRTYGCKSGYGTPVHITLVPPFRLPDEYRTQDIFCALQEYVLPSAEQLAFMAHICNFDAFGDRTVFAKVAADEKWTRLRDAVFSAVLRAVPGAVKRDSRPFQPHLTVANRDIPQGASTGALRALNELELFEDFAVDNITVFERRAGKWIDAGSLLLTQANA